MTVSLPTQSNGDVITATMWNNMIAVVNAGASITPSRCLLTKSNTTALSANTLTGITFDTEVSDPDGQHSTVSNTSRITVATAGLWLVQGSMYFDTQTTAGPRELIIYKNGTYTYSTRVQGANSIANSINVSAVLPLAASDYIELFGWQNGTGSVNCGGNVNYCWFHMTKLGS